MDDASDFDFVTAIYWAKGGFYSSGEMEFC